MLQIVDVCSVINDIELKNINLHISRNEFGILFGADDAGKTELLQTIMGSAVYKGEISYSGENIRRIKVKERRKIRLVPDGILLFQKMKVKAYLNCMEYAHKVKDREYRRYLLDYFEIDERAFLLDMTYEENKLTAIIGALLTRPELLILDEPGNFLSEESYRKLLELLYQLNQEGMTILLIAEHYEEAEQYASHFFYMKEGELVKSGAVDRNRNLTKVVTVKKGLWEELDFLFGQPVESQEDGHIYFTDMDWEMIGKILKKSNVEDMDVTIRMADMQEILDVLIKREKDE